MSSALQLRFLTNGPPEKSLNRLYLTWGYCTHAFPSTELVTFFTWFLFIVSNCECWGPHGSEFGSLPQPNYIIYLKLNFKALNVVYMISIHKSVSPVQIFPLNFTHVFTCSLSIALTNYYKLGGIKLKFTLSQFRRPETWNQGVSRAGCWRRGERSCSGSLSKHLVPEGNLRHILQFIDTLLQSCLCPHIVLSLVCPCVFTSPSYKDISHRIRTDLNPVWLCNLNNYICKDPISK